MNNIYLIGNLGIDPETKKVGETSVTTFTLAVRRAYKDKEGNSLTDWFRCKAWGNAGELIEKYVKKGDQFGVSGRVEVSSYEDKEGNKKTSFDVIVSEFTLLKNGKIENKENNEVTEDELPY